MREEGEGEGIMNRRATVAQRDGRKEIHACVDDYGSGNVSIRNAKIGELVVAVAGEPIEDISALSEDGGRELPVLRTIS